MPHGIKHVRSQGLIDAAYRFAEQAHRGQIRKYTGEPYINHPVAVARIVASVTDDCECIAAALLHDVIEDCGVTEGDLFEAGFGFHISAMVVQLSDVSRPQDGNRAARKALDRQHLAGAWSKTKTVKLADLIDNSVSIFEHGGGFADVYREEMCLLLDEALADGDAELYQRAWEIVTQR